MISLVNPWAENRSRKYLPRSWIICSRPFHRDHFFTLNTAYRGCSPRQVLHQCKNAGCALRSHIKKRRLDLHYVITGRLDLPYGLLTNPKIGYWDIRKPNTKPESGPNLVLVGCLLPHWIVVVYRIKIPEHISSIRIMQ